MRRQKPLKYRKSEIKISQALGNTFEITFKNTLGILKYNQNI